MVESNGEKIILSDIFEEGDVVIGYFERAVNGYWIKGCIAGNLLDDGSRIVFKNGISVGRTNVQKWFRVLGSLNEL